jgi:transposase
MGKKGLLTTPIGCRERWAQAGWGGAAAGRRFQLTLFGPRPFRTHTSRKLLVTTRKSVDIPKTPSEPKTTRRKHSSEIIAVNLALDAIGYSIRQICNENGLPKSTVYGIIRRAVRNPDSFYRKARRTGRPAKLDERAERRLMRYIGANPRQTIAFYFTHLKSGYLIHLNTTRRYLKKNEIYAFRPRKKPYLSKAHKRFRMKWAKEYQF